MPCEAKPSLMKKNLLVVSCLAIMSVALVYGQAAAPQGKAAAPAAQLKAQAAAPAPKGASAAQLSHTAAEERALVDKYCVVCHNTKAKATGLDSSLRLTLDALGIERAHFAGWSGGGRALIEFALAYPERVRSLTLVEPAAYWMQGRARAGQPSVYCWRAQRQPSPDLIFIAATGELTTTRPSGS